MSFLGDQISIRVESDDHMSCSSLNAHKANELLEEGFGSIDPFDRNEDIPLGIPISIQNVSFAESDSGEGVSTKVRSNRPDPRQRKSLSVNPKSQVSAASLDLIKIDFHIPDDIEMKPPSTLERIDMNVDGWCAMYLFPFNEGFRFPFPPFIASILDHFEIAPCQLMPNAWRVLLSLCRFPELFGVGVELEEFMNCYMLLEHDSDKGRIKIVVRSSKKRLVLGLTDNYRYWKDKYLFFRGESMFVPNSHRFPLAWKPLNKEFNRVPHLTPCRKERLQFLLSRPEKQRRFDQILSRSALLSSSLWSSVRANLTVANGTRPISVLELTGVRSIELVYGSSDPLWNLSDITRMRADRIIENMSFKLPATKDALATLKKSSKQSASGTDHSTDQSLQMIMPAKKSVDSQRYKRTRFEVDGDDGVKVLRIQESANIFLDPSSIEAHVKGLTTEDEARYLKELGPIRIADDVVASSYRTMVGAVALRQECKLYAERLKISKKAGADLLKEKNALEEEVKQLREKAQHVDQLEVDLKKEKETIAGLTSELDDLATKCIVKARGEVLLEYKKGRVDLWDVEGDVGLFKSFFPVEYAEALAKLDERSQTSERCHADVSELVGQRNPAEDQTL